MLSDEEILKIIEEMKVEPHFDSMVPVLTNKGASKILSLEKILKISEEMGVKIEEGCSSHKIYNDNGELIDLDLDSIGNILNIVYTVPEPTDLELIDILESELKHCKNPVRKQQLQRDIQKLKIKVKF